MDFDWPEFQTSNIIIHNSMLTHMRTVVISGGDTRKKDPRTKFVALQVYVVPSPPLFIVVLLLLVLSMYARLR